MAQSAEPVIGVLYSAAQARALPGKDELSNYTRAVRDNGGVVAVLSPLLSAEETARLLNSVDALLLPGGIDVAPAFYGEIPHEKLEATDAEFDRYEFSALKAATASKMPVLAICKGMQVLNVYAGGSLYQDLPSQLADSKVTHRLRQDGVSKPCYHEIVVSNSSMLGSMLGTGRVKVNSYHHQAVKKIAPGFAVSAVADDGVVEGMENGNMLAVQFHPEKERLAYPPYNAIFKGFIEMAANYAAGGGASAGVKVCGINDKPSVLAALSAAKEAHMQNFALGLLLGTTHFSREKISTEQAVGLVRYIRSTAYSLNLRPRITCVTHLTSSGELIKMIREISAGAVNGEGGLAEAAQSAVKEFNYGDSAWLCASPVFDIIQIHADMPLSEIELVKQSFPGVKIMKAMHIPSAAKEDEGKRLVAQAIALAEKTCIDALLLDSANLSTNQIGGTGLTNDWALAAAIIEAVHKTAGKPVALAGGINPENASEALAKTGADLLDANTGYRFDRPGGGWKPVSKTVSAPKDAFAIASVMRQAGEFRSGFIGRLFE